MCEDCYRCIEANRGSHWELSNSVFGYVEKVGGCPTVEDKYQVGLHCSDVDALSGIDWENFGFGLRPTDFMYIIKCKRGGEWGKGELQPFGNLEISPAAAVLNYGQVRSLPMMSLPRNLGGNLHSMVLFVQSLS